MTKPKPLFSFLLFLFLIAAAPFIGGCFNPVGVSFLWICAFGALLLAPSAFGIGSKVRALCAAAFFILVIISAGVNRFPYFGLTSVLIDWSTRRPFTEELPEDHADFRIHTPQELLPLALKLEEALS